MQRIAGPGALPGNIWSDGNPFTVPPTPGTVVTAAFMQALQEEIATLIEATGRTLSTTDNTQLRAAILDMIGTGQLRRRNVYIAAAAGAAEITRMGIAAPTLLGNLSYVNNARGAWLQFDCTAPTVTPEDIGLSGPYNVFNRQWGGLDFTCRIDVNTVTNSRLWMGLFSASPAALSDPASISCVGFRYEAGVDSGATWRTVSSNGSSSTIKNSSSTIAVNTAYSLRVRHVSGGKFEFLVNDVLVATHDSAVGEYVPGASTPMGPAAMLRHVTDLNNKALRFGWFQG
jgi:hypothetical protein